MNERAGLPLCVDLDGTLVATDTLFEGLMAALRRRPWVLLLLLPWLLRDRAAMKARLAGLAPPEVAALPVRDEVLAYLRDAGREGRPVVLVTASDRGVAEAVARHVGGFDEVLASEPGDNLKGLRKRARLDERFGMQGYEYLGDSAADWPVWAGAACGSSVGLSAPDRQRLEALAPGGRHFDAPRARAASWLRALRVHQWVKNALVFLPLLASHRFLEPALQTHAMLAFASFSLLASAVYVMNDLVDLEADRTHPVNATRPFANGELPIWSGLLAAPVLVAAAFALSTALAPAYAALLGLYLVANLVYTFALKRVAIADVVLLAMLYGLRVLAGGFATGIVVSPWLIAFSLMFFMNLALLKRYADLCGVGRAPGREVAGRGYAIGDAPLLLALGPACGVVASLVLALYAQSDAVRALYPRPTVLFALIPLLLFWIGRFWFRAHRGEVRGDPIVFAVTDPTSYGVLLSGVCVLALAAMP